MIIPRNVTSIVQPDFFHWMDFWANIAVVGGFILTGIFFGITFYRKRKDEQIKSVIEISKELNQTEYNLSNMIQIMKKQNNDSWTSHTTYNYDDLKNAVIKHFRNWEWFALLVNNNEISDDHLIGHLKDNFMSECSGILSKYADLFDNDDKFPEIKKLYHEWEQYWIKKASN